MTYQMKPHWNPKQVYNGEVKMDDEDDMGDKEGTVDALVSCNDIGNSIEDFSFLCASTASLRPTKKSR